jgi:uncharacterized membrane protein YdjX (TVP38/TMEM64 family)
MTKNRILLIITLIAVVSAFFVFNLGQYLTLEYFKPQQAAIEHYRLAHPVMTTAGFFVIYIAVTGLSLPGAALMTLVAGAIFGLTQGTLVYVNAGTQLARSDLTAKASNSAWTIQQKRFA